MGLRGTATRCFLSYATPALIKILDEDEVRGNRLAPAAMVAIAPRTDAAEAGNEFDAHKVVYPASEAGKSLPD
jgi:hypothetical protein